MPSKLYLKVELKNYNLPFDAFASGPMDKAQTMFVTAVQAIRQQDAEKFASVWTTPDEMKSRGDVTVRSSDNTPASWIQRARMNFDFDQLTVVAEVLVGPDSMFVFDSTTKSGVQRYALYVGPDQKNQMRLSAVSSATTVDVLILNALSAARTSPDLYKPLPNLYLRYQYPIPLAGKGDAGAHPVFLEFDGSPVDFPLADEKVKPPTPVLEFFRNANLAYRSGKNSEYAADFTPKSQEKVTKWLAALEIRKAEMQKQEALKPVKQPAKPATVPSVSKPVAGKEVPVKSDHVKFVLNADPVYLVFQAATAPNKGNDWVPGNLTYSYIVRQDGSYRIANFGYSTSLDDLLQDPGLFDKNILKPAPVKLGTPTGKTVLAPVKPKVKN